MQALKKKICLHCDLELNFRNKLQWNEQWDDTLILDKYQELSRLYHGYKREQNTKFIQFKQQIPSKEMNEKYSNKSWLDCVNINDLLKYLFNPENEQDDELKTLDVYVLDYTVMRTMDNPFKFKNLENVTICFVKNDDFGDCFVAREWQQYEA